MFIELDISKSTYYDNKKNLNKPDKDKELKQDIQEIHAKNKAYGYRRIVIALKNNYSQTVNHKKVLKIMNILKISAVRKRRKYKSYKGKVGNVAPNILNRDFSTSDFNQKFVTDVTEFKVCDTKFYLSPLIDLHNKEVVNYSVSTSPTVNFVMEMFKGVESKLSGSVVHSDQGYQYQNKSFS